jgi:pimeloyl-ACP methyl ester carboxylesterase
LTIFVALIVVLLLLELCGTAYQAIGAARDRGRFPPPGRMVDIGGRWLHLIESGSGRPSVILESGISASCLNWTRVRTEVARFTLACAYDRAGLGWSDPADSPRLASRMVEELHALLGAAGIARPYVLVGHSFGGLLVSMYAVRYPDEVAGLVLVDPLAAGEWSRPTPQQSRMLGRGITLARRGAWLARMGVVRFALARLTGGARRVPKGIARLTSGAGESFLSRIVGEVGKMPPEVWPMIQAHWCLPKSFEGLAAALEGLAGSSAEAARMELPHAIPLTILSAKHCTPGELSGREALAARSVRGRHMVAANSGHWIHLDQPELVVEAIREMVEWVRAPTVQSRP